MARYITVGTLAMAAIALAAITSMTSTDPAHAASSPYARVDGAVHAPVPAARPSDEVMAQIMKEIRFDQLAQLPIVLKLEGEALANYQARENQRKAAVKALESGPYSQVVGQRRAALEEAKKAEEPDLKLIGRLERSLEAASNEVWKRRSALRLKVLTSLSDAQQRYWIQFVMYRNLWNRMKRAEFTPEQKDLVWALCSQPAVDHVEQGLIHIDPYLSKTSITMEMLNEKIRTKVVREDQSSF
jgi:hypothetical protein